MLVGDQRLDRLQQFRTRAMRRGSDFLDGVGPSDEVVLHDPLDVRDDDVAEPDMVLGLSRMGDAAGDAAHDERRDRREVGQQQAGTDGGDVGTHAGLGYDGAVDAAVRRGDLGLPVDATRARSRARRRGVDCEDGADGGRFVGGAAVMIPTVRRSEGVDPVSWPRGLAPRSRLASGTGAWSVRPAARTSGG